MDGIRIKFGFEIDCDDTEPSAYVTLYHGQILGPEECPDDGEGDFEPDVRLGEFELYLVNRGRISNESAGVFEALDCTSPALIEFYDALIDPKIGGWKEEIEVLIGEDLAILYDMLLIKRLELDEKFRGKGIGAQVVRAVIRTLGANCGVIACKPFPLQYHGYADPEKAMERASLEYETMRLAAFAKVAKFWANAGFYPLPESNCYIWIPEEWRPVPSSLA